MPLINTYFDGYLKNQVTEEREARAVTEVAEIGTFAAEWVSRLTVLRAYVITCLECQAAPDDLFAQKLKNYRSEFEAVLAQAKSATTDSEGKPMQTLTVSLERA